MTSILSMPPDSRNPTSRNLVDDADCGGCNDGKCIEPTASDPSDAATSTSTSSSSALGPSCDCRGTEFIGEHCDVPCSKSCENGGKCVPAPSSSSSGGGAGEESCSCTKAVVDGNPYAGLRCEYGATKSCMTLGSSSKHSFCVNGGECADIVLDNEQHADCVCPGGFEGPHCEYLAGEAPAGSMASTTTVSGAALASTDGSTQSREIDAVVFILIVVIAAVIGVLLLAFFVRGRRRRSDAKRMERQAREATKEFSMVPSNDPENEII